MKVLIACEESQRVCTAFRRQGHEAYSCDIIEPSERLERRTERVRAVYGERSKIVKKPIDGKTTRRELNVFEKWLQIEQDITEALKKQYPEEPIDYNDNYYECPVCGYPMAIEHPKYCPECGQALDWRNKNGDNT